MTCSAAGEGAGERGGAAGEPAKTLALRRRARRWLLSNPLLLATAAGVLGGALLGFALRPLELGPDATLLLSYPGELVMRLLKLMILPLIIASLVSGAARLNASANGRMAARMLVYFVLTSLLNAALGTALVLALRPGEGSPRARLSQPQTLLQPQQAVRQGRILDNFLDLGRNVFADNLFQAAFQQAHTEYVAPAAAQGPNCSGADDADDADDAGVQAAAVPTLERRLRYRDGTNTLGIIFFCLIFGTVLGHMGHKARVVVEFFNVLDEAIMRIVTGVMWLTPLGIASVICGKVLEVADVMLMASMLGWFIFTVALGVMIYQLFFMQLIYFAIVKRNPYRFYWQLAPATLTAFATASTAAALPLALRCLERDARVHPRVSRFVLPIGCTINMDGTALFVAVAAGFLVQLSGIELSTADAITLCLAATAASFSSASVPSAALVLIFMVLATLNVPQKDVPLLFAVDWFVDRVRTTNNMLGDCYAAAVVERLSRAELEAADAAEDDEAGGRASPSPSPPHSPPRGGTAGVGVGGWRDVEAAPPAPATLLSNGEAHRQLPLAPGPRRPIATH